MTVLTHHLRASLRRAVQGRGYTYPQLRQIMRECLAHQSHLLLTAYVDIGIGYIVQRVIKVETVQ